MKAICKKYNLQFKRPAGTSRGVLLEKETWFIHLENEYITSIGECNLFRGLSCDDVPNYETRLHEVCAQLSDGVDWDVILLSLMHYPSIMFGVETALRDSGQGILYPSSFTEGKQGIAINGLIWMGDVDNMLQQIKEKIEQGFKVLKLKIGALNWEQELFLITQLRKNFSSIDLEIRVDANGAFMPHQVLAYLQALADLHIHSIEQPIKQGQIDDMANLCKKTPLPIALDEELIGVHTLDEKEKLLHYINPQYLILKPALLGGFKASEEWIDLAKQQNIGWWITSALESNVGLNAIAQWTYTLQNPLPQGLGTGALYTNNIPSPLKVIDDSLWYLK